MTQRDEDAIRAAHFWLDMEMEEERLEIEAAYDRAAQTVELLAWVIRQRNGPEKPSVPESFPRGQNFYQRFDLHWLVFRDPLIFDVARSDTADLLEQYEDGAIGHDEHEVPQIISFAAQLVRARPPVAGRGPWGDNLARNFLIISALYQGGLGGEPYATFELPRRKRDESDPWDDGIVSLSAAADHLSNLLMQASWLADSPNAAPTPEAIRAVWRAKADLRKVVVANKADFW